MCRVKGKAHRTGGQGREKAIQGSVSGRAASPRGGRRSLERACCEAYEQGQSGGFMIRNVAIRAPRRTFAQTAVEVQERGMKLVGRARTTRVFPARSRTRQEAFQASLEGSSRAYASLVYGSAPVEALAPPVKSLRVCRQPTTTASASKSWGAGCASGTSRGSSPTRGARLDRSLV